jgi:hypothetical protein
MDKQVYYFKDGRDWDDLELTGIDLTKAIYNGQSVSITAIQVALYMGFSQIYLLGLDHNWICTQLHEQHFYAKQDSIIDRKYDVALRQTTNLRTTFEAHARLWAQYERLKAFAQSNNALICNATNGGLLDVFDRVKYESLV